MNFIADLHIHSRFSRATSKQLSPRHLAAWARCKGINVLGTGDFTHPKWRDELRQQLVRDEASGLYRLEEIAPDHFRQSEYYLSYFHDNVLEDEVQFILQVPGQGALSLSLGMQRMFADEECGMLGLLSSWVLALMQQHWQQRSQRLLPAAPQEEMATQIRDALSHFGASVLSERELEIARLILRGYSSKAMAERLAISPETIKVHRRHLYAKLDISSQPELFSLFIQSLGHDPENP